MLMQAQNGGAGKAATHSQPGTRNRWVVYRVLVGKPKGKRPLGRPRRRWEDNIRMDLQEVGLGYEDWIGTGIGTGGRRL